jgi:hypothetical protein
MPTTARDFIDQPIAQPPSEHTCAAATGGAR